MSLEETLARLKKKCEETKNAMIRQQAQLELALEGLKTLGYNSVEDAEQALERLGESIEALEDDLKIKEEEFDAEFGHLLQSS
jgi:Holliday junction resolvasome RuvABC DNA-binding subunit